MQSVNALCSLVIIGATVFLWFSIVSFKVTIALILIQVSILIKAGLKWKSIQEKGFLNVISERGRQVLLERSLFDILCDIWYFQAIKRHVKAFLSPFFIRKSPEELIESFDDINPAIKNAVLTKGVINILPEALQQQLKVNYNQLEPVKRYATSWDRVRDYEQFVGRKKSAKTLLHLMSLLLHKPMVQVEDYRDGIKKLNSKTRSLFVLSIIAMAAQVYFVKSSRRVYSRALVTASTLGLMGAASVSFALLMAARKKSQI